MINEKLQKAEELPLSSWIAIGRFLIHGRF